MSTREVYPTDVTEQEWQQLEPLVPAPKPGGRPITYPRREIVNAIFYLLRTGGAWRVLPHDFPPWRIVFYYFWSWRQAGMWEKIHDTLRGDLRQAAGRQRQPSAGRLDSQTVNPSEKGGATAMLRATRLRGASVPC